MAFLEIPISVAVPACRRFVQLRTTLNRLRDCDPSPAEILVHLDGNDAGLRAMVEKEFPSVRLLHSTTLVGPGGARNRLNFEARCSWVAHFDDDSFPEGNDFFAKAWDLISRYPDTAVFAAAILPGEVDPKGLWLHAYFIGCGHLMNKEWFLRTRGYLPLQVAYNLEEVDVSLQLYDLGGRCLLSGGLRVIHDHPVPLRETEDTQVAMMINTVLFPLLRYSLLLWPQVCISILRRLWGLILRAEWRIIFRVGCKLPAAIFYYFPLRTPLRAVSTWSWLLLRRWPLRVTPVAALSSISVHD